MPYHQKELTKQIQTGFEVYLRNPAITYHHFSLCNLVDPELFGLQAQTWVFMNSFVGHCKI